MDRVIFILFRKRKVIQPAHSPKLSSDIPKSPSPSALPSPPGLVQPIQNEVSEVSHLGVQFGSLAMNEQKNSNLS